MSLFDTTPEGCEVPKYAGSMWRISVRVGGRTVTGVGEVQFMECA